MLATLAFPLLSPWVAALSASLAHLAERVEHHEGTADRLERMQQAARRFDWDDSARQTRAVYERVVGEKARHLGQPLRYP